MTAPSLPRSPGHPAPFRLGDLEIRPDSGEVRGPRGDTRLRPLLVQILLRLAAEPGAVVRRETLLDEAWPRRMVADEVLSRAIAELRTALGDDARAARYIETLPKIGYRLVAPVAPMGAAAAAPLAPLPARARAGPGAAAIASVAVVAVLVVSAVALWAPRRVPAFDVGSRIAAARVFTSDTELEVGPRFSPDGASIAFAMGAGNSSRVVVQSIAASTRHVVGEGADLRLYPVFFPDGRRIAYWKRAPGGDCAIVEHVLASGIERTLVDCALAPRARFDLSRDGRRIVFSGQAHAQAPAGLWIAEVDGGAPRPLTTPGPGAGDDVLPRFSPDGTRVAFFRGNESHRQPWLVEIGAAPAARALGAHEGLVYGAAWLGPDGPLLVAADWFGFRALNVLDVASGEARLAGARGARSPDVGPGGEVAWEHAEYSANLWLARPDAQPRALWRTTRYTGQPEFAPDGRHVAFASNRDGTDAIYVAALEGPARRIAFGDGWRYSRPHWAADGMAVYATRVAVGPGAAVPEAVRIPLSGGAAEVLALGGPVADARESADGRWLYWAVPSGGALALWRAPAKSPSASERLPLPAMSHYQMNARWLVFAQPQHARLTACRLDTLACAPLGAALAPGELYHWALGAGSIYMRERGPDGVAVARIDLATGRRLGALAIAPGGSGSSIAVAPDESAVLFAQEEGPTVDLMLAR